MSKSLTAVITIITVILIGIGTWWFLSAQPTQPAQTTSSPSTPPKTQEPATSTEESNGATIVFTDNGFAQQNYSVAAGQAVTVKNESSIAVEFSSDEHPTHRDNPELNMNALQPGQQESFTPSRTGEWGVHDHIHPQFTTMLAVTN